MQEFLYQPNQKKIESITLQDVIYAKQYFGMSSAKVECPLARIMLDELAKFGPPESINNYIVDSKVVQLMKGMYPCIPGWHLDEVRRDENGQLDYNNNEWMKQHYMMLIDFGTGSLTEFYERPRHEYIKQMKGYDDLNDLINSEIEYERNTQKQRLELEKRPFISSKIETCESGKIYNFDCQDPHRGTPAKANGWRYFIRATYNSQRKIMNQLRPQTQVYIPVSNLDKGW